MSEAKLTPRQQAILTYIKNSLRRRGYPPSVREIGDAVGLCSSSTVHGHLAKLEKLGYIRRDPAKPRAIEVVEDAAWRNKRITPVPLVGRVTAGTPILAVENVEDVYPLPTDLVRSDDVFMLAVQGDSMVNAGILDGDYVIVRQQNTADPGDIVVALIEDEATVKRFFPEKGYVRLQPENDAMRPIIVHNVTILGKVIGLFRKM